MQIPVVRLTVVKKVTFRKVVHSMTNQPGWAVVLLGEVFDVDDLRERLPAPFDPWVEVYSDPGGDGLVLRSKAWANLTEARDVHMDADRILERLHGEALLYDPDSTRVLPGGVFNFHDDGRKDAIAVLHAAELKVTLGRMRARATGTTGGPPPPPSETDTQKWFQRADNDDARAELLSHISRVKDWFDIYMVMEITRRVAGNRAKLKAALGTDCWEWDRVWRTANCKRHAPDPIKYPLPTPPSEFDRSRLLVFKVAKSLL